MAKKPVTEKSTPDTDETPIPTPEEAGVKKSQAARFALWAKWMLSIKEKKEELAKEEAEIRDQFKDAMETYGLARLRIEGCGNFALRDNSPRASLDKGKLKTYFIEVLHLPPLKVQKAFDASTSYKDPETPRSLVFKVAAHEEE